MGGTKGEGSRGGHVIGHTKSGYAKYEGTADKIMRVAKAGALGASGAGTAIYAGIKAARFTQHAANMENSARTLKFKHEIYSSLRGKDLSNNRATYAHEDRALDKLAKGAKTASREASIANKTSFGIRTVGTIVGGALIGKGIADALSTNKDSKAAKQHKEKIAAVSGAIAGFALNTSFYKALGATAKVAAKTAAARTTSAAITKLPLKLVK